MTVASQNLHVAQSAVSTAITQLEKSLGTTLFIRQHSKGLVLTAAGSQFLRETAPSLTQLSDAAESLRESQRGITGVITIACFRTLLPLVLPRLLGHLSSAHPHLRVEIIEGDYRENISALRDGKAELILGYDFGTGDDIRQEPVGSTMPHILLPRDHRLASRDSIALKELQSEPFILLDLPSSRDYFLNVLAAAGCTPEVRYQTTSYEAVRSLVSEGLGFSILNQTPQTAETYTGKYVKTVAIADSVPALKIVLTSLTQVAPSARATAVSEAIREILSR